MPTDVKGHYKKNPCIKFRSFLSEEEPNLRGKPAESFEQPVFYFFFFTNRCLDSVLCPRSIGAIFGFDLD